jgi:ribosomal protein L30/L7E
VKDAIVLGGESRLLRVEGLRVDVDETTERGSSSRSRLERDVVVLLRLRRPSSSSFFADEPPSLLPVSRVHLVQVGALGTQLVGGCVGGL